MREEFNNTEFSTCVMMMNTNCISHIAITKGFLQTLIGQSDGARIVNILSIAGLIGTGFRTMYSAAKFGTAGFFKALRAEVRQHGIGITNIYPEFVKTNISRNAVLGGGQAFGKTDSNHLTGIEVDYAADFILRSIYLKYDEVILGRILYHILPSLCFLSTTINNFIGKIAYKRSKKAIAEAH
jgi:dehydrogenase/reductase SDR family member 7B